jgi:AhpD family alkylhydroperoxidase
VKQEMKQLLERMKTTNSALARDGYAEQIKAWRAFSAIARRDGVLSGKYKALIAMAVGLSKQCATCVAYHTEAAFHAGATAEEILEAAFVAVLMSGGPAMCHLDLVVEAIEEFRPQE